jgi:uncharacterized protein YuzE
MTYRISHDPESGALYVRLREGEYHETISLGDPGLGAGVDVDAQGNVLGVEFLSFEEFAEVVADSGGALELPENLGSRAEESAALWGAAAGIAIDGPDSEVEIPRRPSESAGDLREEVSESVGDVTEEASESEWGVDPRPPRRSDRRANR